MAARIRTLLNPRFVLGMLFALLLGGVLVASAPPAVADVDDFTFDSFHADMSLTRGADGHAELAIIETIVARFPDADQNRGIVRAIPDDYQGVPLDTQVISVTGGDGTPIPYAVDERGDFVEVATGDDSYVRGVQTYVITYTQRDSVRAFEDTGAQEFYRDLNGTGWSQPFGEVSATIVIDPALTGALTGGVACYVGAEGSTKTCTIDERGGSAGEVLQLYPQAYDLAPGENVTVAIGFAPGTFVPGEVERNAVEEFALSAGPALQAGSLAALVASIAAAAGAIVVHRRGRDAAGRGIIVAQYDPPTEVSVVQAAHLLGRPATAIPAAIVDLAVHGNARIIEAGDDTVNLEYVAPSDDPGRQRALDSVFEFTAEPGARVWLGGDTRIVASRLAAFSASAIGELRAAGLTKKRSQGWPAAVFTVALVAFVVAVASAVLAAVGQSATALSIAAVVVGLAAGIVTVAMWRRRDRVTDAGALVRDHLEGLRDYLELAEADRIRMLQSPDGAERSAEGVFRLFERLLPYAVIWGVEREWAEVLETRVRESDAAIGWYAGANGFSSAQFAATLVAARGATNPSTAAWAASGGSSLSGGSFGGGFSGGGAGGGGGGGR
jgi:uncharacterized membrane protein YgcG